MDFFVIGFAFLGTVAISYMAGWTTAYAVDCYHLKKELKKKYKYPKGTIVIVEDKTYSKKDEE